MSAPLYAELHCLSNFTFLRGASHPDELVTQAAALGYSALALTDECSVAGVVRAHVAAKAIGLKLIIGSEFQLQDEPGGSAEAPGLKLVLLAMDRVGYGQLCTLITRGRRRALKGRYSLQCADLDHSLDRCLALLLPAPRLDTAAVQAQAQWLAAHFPERAWIAYARLYGAQERNRLARLRAIAAAAGVPLVAAGDVHMHTPERRPLQDLLTAIRLTVPVHQAGHALYPNGERHLRPRERLAKLYPPELLAETGRIAARCTFNLDELRYEYPDELVPSGHTAASYLRLLTAAGIAERWPAGASAPVRAQVERELALIEELHYEPYFLTVHDVVRYARAQGILCQGRGSAANSAVCYCLGITSVDPAHSEMLFERFISRERNEPPDIDVDFEHERREEVIQYLYRKYTRERAALTATVISYRPRSALRDAGKALGLDLDQVDRLASSLAWWDRRELLPQRLREAGFDPDNPIIHRLLALVAQMLGFPRHLSQHVGGFVIARGPLAELVPVENAAMVDRTVIQWDKDDLDALGLLKIDCLALGMLSAIRRAFDLVARHRGRTLTLATLPQEDPAVYRMIQRGDTIGVFQIESRAQMAMLPRLKPRTFYDLVIEVAIVRPGPIQGDMVHPYLRRRQGLEAVSYPSEAVRGVLERTLGIPIFQEQVIKLAMVAAGFSPGDADGLRRAMAAWRRRGGLEPYEERLREGMAARGYDPQFAEQIVAQIKGFGEYGFPESHAASFALLVYVSAWLKHHEPAAFSCALLNSQPMGFYASAQLVQDARRHGVEVRPVDVSASDWDCTLEPSGARLALRLGLGMVKGMSRSGAERLVAARAQRPWRDVEDLAHRAALDRGDLEHLAAANALLALAGHRRQARWATLAVEPPSALLRDAPVQEALPLLPPPGEADEVVDDYAHLGLTLGRHPLAFLRTHLKRQRSKDSLTLRATPSGRRVTHSGLVISRQCPSSSSGTVFLTLEDEHGSVNVVVWRRIGERHRPALLGARLLEVHGKIEREGEVMHLIAERLEDRSHLLGALLTRSRDFH